VIWQNIRRSRVIRPIIISYHDVTQCCPQRTDLDHFFSQSVLQTMVALMYVGVTVSLAGLLYLFIASRNAY